MERKKDFSFIVTVLVLAAFVLLNVFAGMLTERFYIKADLTESGLYTVDPLTAGLLADMEDTVDVIVLQEEAVWLADPGAARIVEILRQYSVLSGGRFRVQYVNPDLNSFNGPEYGNNLTTLREAHSELTNMGRNDIVLLSSRRADFRPVSALYTQEGLNADMELTAALLHVLNEQVAKAVFLEGHNEDTAEYLRSLFERSGYVCVNVNLAMAGLPEDTTVVISAGPKFDFLSEEILKLEEYLSNGGNAMIFYDFGTISLPRLDAFLAEWGIAVEAALICDAEWSVLSQPSLIVTGINPGIFHSLHGADGFAVVAHRSRPLRRLWEGDTQGRFSANPLLLSSPSSYTVDFGDGDRAALDRQEGDRPGPFPVAYHVRFSATGGGGEQIRSDLIVSGMGVAEDFVMEYFTGMYFNMPLFASLAGEFNPYGESIYIAPKSLRPSIMPLTPGQERSVLIVMVIALPLVIMLTGIFVYRKRRHR
jgi:hypothetical protein